MARADEPELRPDIDDWDEYVQPNLCRAPAYPYRELIDNDIRLLNILPGHEVLECTLHQMPLTEEQMFYALSYVWGDWRETKEILLEGKPFKVTQNLYEALLQLREQPGSPLKLGYPDDYFWIDAICLNQEDVDEKAQQIPRMMEIYHASLNVVIWLGPNNPMTKLEMLGRMTAPSSTNPVEFLQRGNTSSDSIIGLLFKKADSLWTDWELPDDAAREESVLHKVFGESYGAVLRASTELLQRPWFSRVWTVQECTLEVPSSVFAGRHRVKLDSLITLLKVLVRHNRIMSLAPGLTRILALDQINKKWHLKHGLELQGQKLETNIAESFLEILSYIKGTEATNPRDQVYGLLSLVTYFAETHLPMELMPNYRLSFEDIYWQYAAYLFENSGDLRLLSTDRHELQGVPSWVPDFRYLVVRKRVECEPTVRVSPDKRILYLQGIRMVPICDNVDEWDNPRWYPVNGIQPDLHHRIRYVEGRIFKLASQIRGVALEDTLDDFLWKATILFNEGGMNGTRRAYSDLRGYSGRNGPWLSKRQRTKTTDAFGRDFTIADDFCRSLILLEDGTILRVSREAVDIMPGDIVCIFKGAAHPSLIRPSGQSDSFVFLAHCDIRFGTFYRQQLDEDFWTERTLEEFRII
ncbi:heterokaryon incompatibility protein-domain-containing protein [Xylariaceae sp. AK1471]|nr:heterokaryon incompatibility protein-domain-containing protein [Xylariaceae sp. AK1471]